MSQKKSREILSSTDSDSDQEHQAKKMKRKEKNVEEKSKKKAKSGDGPEDHMYPLNRQRFVKVREFRGKVLIDIREYYTDDTGDLKPGKKGISLSQEQWVKLKDYIDDVDESIQAFC